mgnify:CR=1 FL=1
MLSKYNTKKKIIFSNEGVTSVFFSYKDLVVKARRVKQLIPEAKIIFVIRNQFDWFESQYRDHPFDPRDFTIGKSVSFDKWVNIVGWSQSIKLKGALDYFSVVSCYEELFGRENLKVLLFEDLSVDLAFFVKEISDFMGIEESEAQSLLQGAHENRGVTRWYNIYRQLTRNNHFSFLSKGLKFFVPKEGRRTKAKYYLSDQNKNRLDKWYGKGNQKLMKEYGLNLSKYNYPGINRA